MAAVKVKGCRVRRPGAGRKPRNVYVLDRDRDRLDPAEKPVVLWARQPAVLPIGKAVAINPRSRRLAATIRFLPAKGYGAAGEFADQLPGMAGWRLRVWGSARFDGSSPRTRSAGPEIACPVSTTRNTTRRDLIRDRTRQSRGAVRAAVPLAITEPPRSNVAFLCRRMPGDADIWR